MSTLLHVARREPPAQLVPHHAITICTLANPPVIHNRWSRRLAEPERQDIGRMDGFPGTAGLELAPRATQGAGIDVRPKRGQESVETQSTRQSFPIEEIPVVDSADMRLAPAPADGIGQPPRHRIVQEEISSTEL